MKAISPCWEAGRELAALGSALLKGGRVTSSSWGAGQSTGQTPSLLFAHVRVCVEPGRGDFSLPLLCLHQFSQQIWGFPYLPGQCVVPATLGNPEP